MDVKKIAEKIKGKQREQENIRDDISRIAKKAMPDYLSYFNTIGHWDCDKSPIGLCIYNHMKDGALDDCLFCHEPNERK